MAAPDAASRAAQPARRGIVAVLGRPQFALLTVGQTVSQLGDRLHNMALLGLVAAAADTQTTGLEIAKVTLATALPTAFAPVVGALVDRWNKQFTMIFCDLTRTVIVALIPLLYLSLGVIWPVYVVAFFVGLCGTFFNAAKMSLIPDLVDHADLLAANAALTTIGRVATVSGFVLGGVMVDWGIWHRIGWEGWEAGFYTDAFSYGISVITLVTIAFLSHAAAKRARGHHHLAESAALVRGKVRDLIGDMRATFALIRSDHGLRFVFLTVIVLGATAGSIANIFASASLAVLNAGTRGVGFLGGILAGGMIVGSLLVGTIGSRWDKRWMIVIGCLLMGAFMLAGSIWFSYAIFMPIAFMGGVVLAPVMVSMDTLLHEWSPRSSRALVFSTRDTVLGATFMAFSGIVGLSIALLGNVVRTPYAVAMFIFGTLVIAGTLGAAATQLGLRRAGALK